MINCFYKFTNNCHGNRLVRRLLSICRLYKAAKIDVWQTSETFNSYCKLPLLCIQ